MNGRFLTNPRDGKLMGVCAGLSDITGVDPLLFRLALVVATLVTGPVVPILYFVTGWLATSKV